MMNIHTITSPKIMINTEPPNAIASTVITVKIVNISSKIINNIIIVTLLSYKKVKFSRENKEDQILILHFETINSCGL